MWKLGHFPHYCQHSRVVCGGHGGHSTSAGRATLQGAGWSQPGKRDQEDPRHWLRVKADDKHQLQCFIHYLVTYVFVYINQGLYYL